MQKTFGQQLNRIMADHFVGRTFEMGLFREFLERMEEHPERILNVFGTAGMGKTYLLDRFTEITREFDRVPIRIHMSEAMNDPRFITQMIVECVGDEAQDSNLAMSKTDSLTERCINAVHAVAEKQKVVLLIDGYEEAGGLDNWLRTLLLPQLPQNTLIVIAGRFELEGPWRYTPAWKKLIVRLPLAELSYEDIRQYMLQWGELNEAVIDTVWLRTLGHPLAMSLLTPMGGEMIVPERPSRSSTVENLQLLLENWLQEAPNDQIRELLYAASITRTFSQELLEELTRQPVPSKVFDRLIQLSFVARTAGGWQLHDLVWENLRSMFRERMPGKFDRFCRIAVDSAVKKIIDGIGGVGTRARELAELLHFAGNPIMRAHYRHSRISPHYLEPMNVGNIEELTAFIKRRRTEPRAMNIRCSDPEFGEMYRFEIAPGEGLLRLSLLETAWLSGLPEQSVQLLRSEEGKVIGVFAAIPICAKTRDFLAAAPVSQAFFRTLTSERRQVLEAAIEQERAWYLYSVDVENLEEEQLRSDIVRHLFDLVLAGSLIVSSPPPLPYYEQSQISLGFEEVPGAAHFDYGTAKPAATYWLDTRQEKLRHFLERMIGLKAETEMELRNAVVTSANLSELTERERDVACLLAEGYSNMEIAAALFVSEAAVKKHVNAMLSKFDLKNRTQLARHVLLKR